MRAQAHACVWRQVTQWDGEVVDNTNHSFLTRAWGASRASDLKHWGRFAAFGLLRNQVMQTRGRCAQPCSWAPDHAAMPRQRPSALLHGRQKQPGCRSKSMGCGAGTSGVNTRASCEVHAG
jgi:hypothetical protein